jgi:hypothetical protein
MLWMKQLILWMHSVSLISFVIHALLGRQFQWTTLPWATLSSKVLLSKVLVEFVDQKWCIHSF